MKIGLNIFGKKAFLPVEVVYDCLEMSDTAQKMKFSIKGFFFSNCDQIHRELQICLL